MRRKLLPLLLALACLLSACAQEPSETVQIYRVLTERANGELVRAETVKISARADPVQATIDAFNAPAQDSGLENPLPEYAALKSGTLENGTLTLEAEPGYRVLTGMELTQANACVVLTFAALPDVERVTIRSGDRVLCNAMTPDSLALTDTSTGD